MGRGGTLWDTLASENSLTNATFMEIQKRCKYCGRSFIAHKMTTIYCSPSCNNKDYKRAIRQKQIADYCEAHPEDKEDTPKDVLHGKAFLTPREAAKLLGIGKSSVYRELASGLIKAVQMKGKTLIRRDCLTILQLISPIRRRSRRSENTTLSGKSWRSSNAQRRLL